MNTIITRSLSLFSLFIVSNNLYAAKLINESDILITSEVQEVNVLNYTATHNKKSINQINAQDVDSVDLVDDVDTAFSKAKDNPMLAAVILSDQKSCKKNKQSHAKDDQKESEKKGQGYIDFTNIEEKTIYKKYLLDAQGLLNQNAHKITHTLGYHVIQTQKAHIVVALMQWLQKSPERYLYDVAFSDLICPKCGYLLSLLGYQNEVKVGKKGCQGSSFQWPMPPLAQQYLNSFILNSGKPLEVTQAILDNMLGISERSYNQLKHELNTIQLKLTNQDNVIDELRKEVTNKNNLLHEFQNEFSNKNNQLNEIRKKFHDSQNLLNNNKSRINALEMELENKEKLLLQTQNAQNIVKERTYEFNNQSKTLEHVQEELKKVKITLNNKENLVNEIQLKLSNKENLIDQLSKELNNKKIIHEEVQLKLTNKENLLNETQLILTNKENLLNETQLKLNIKDSIINELRKEVNKTQNSLFESQQLLKQLLDNNNVQNNSKPKPQLNNKKYKGKVLPQDLSGQNLRGYDFTGCHFTYTNLTNTNLEGVILKNTTCDYQKALLDNFKNHGDSGHRESLSKDMKQIADSYPKLKIDANKAQLLRIASALARLPLYKTEENKEFNIKMRYWFCELMQLQKKLLVYQPLISTNSIVYYNNNEAAKNCWTTEYPQDKITIHDQAPHDDFDRYLKDFTDGLIKYNCKSIYNTGFRWYKISIQYNIKGLKKIYSKVHKKEIQAEIRQIAHALAKSYQIEKLQFLTHYLHYQHRLIELKALVKYDDIYYTGCSH